MKVYINEEEVDANLMSVNTGLNFGRFDYEGLVVSYYKIVLPTTAFIEAIEQEYTDIRDEIKLDDEEQKETSEFTAIQYGPISKLIENAQALRDVTVTYLDKPLFCKLFEQSDEGTFVINSTDLVEVVADRIEISGRCHIR
ncbi:hypothetical protein GCM10009119_16830 [Algoriphagus jejuensis]|uniref:Uncharacterized protein n=1 Tax=Algoriphagus jejuensis TaxID=419934 RepID=A0ABN1MZZ8_9BACT